MKKLIAIILFTVGVSFSQEIPTLNYYATDYTGTLTRDEVSSLNEYLKAVEDSSSNQIVFLMISSLDEASLEDYAFKVAEKNKIGQQGRDNGVLFIVVKDDRKMRIEVGYGLEGVLPDALASQIIRNEATPYFRNGDYYGGVFETLYAIDRATRGEYAPISRHIHDIHDFEEDMAIVFLSFSIIGFIVFIIFIIALKSKGGGYSYSSEYSSDSSSWSSSYSSSGFSSSSSGGFSGGGGSFGGGGASGSW